MKDGEYPNIAIVNATAYETAVELESENGVEQLATIGAGMYDNHLVLENVSNEELRKLCFRARGDSYDKVKLSLPTNFDLKKNTCFVLCSKTFSYGAKDKCSGKLSALCNKYIYLCQTEKGPEMMNYNEIKKGLDPDFSSAQHYKTVVMYKDPAMNAEALDQMSSDYNDSGMENVFSWKSLGILFVAMLLVIIVFVVIGVIISKMSGHKSDDDPGDVQLV